MSGEAARLEERRRASPVSRLKPRAWSFACHGCFARRTKKKERLLVVQSSQGMVFFQFQRDHSPFRLTVYSVFLTLYIFAFNSAYSYKIITEIVFIHFLIRNCTIGYTGQSDENKDYVFNDSCLLTFQSPRYNILLLRTSALIGLPPIWSSVAFICLLAVMYSDTFRLGAQWPIEE